MRKNNNSDFCIKLPQNNKEVYTISPTTFEVGIDMKFISARLEATFLLGLLF